MVLLSSPLEALSSHPIFKKIATEQPPVGAANAADETRMASRGEDELFVASGNVIRCTQLTAPGAGAGAELSSSHNYKVLDLESVDFHIRFLKINASGSLLAAYDEHQVVVCWLPERGFMLNYRGADTIPVKSYQVGASFFANCQIRDLLWDKLSFDDAELVVLTSDNHVRRFDLMTSSQVPYRDWDLAELSGNLLGLSESIVDARSISFGSHNQANPAMCLSLYIFTADGDLYTMYPFVANTIGVTHAFVQNLFDHTTVALNLLPPARRGLLIQQLHFASVLHREFNKRACRVRLDSSGDPEQYHMVETAEFQQLPQVQGLFRLSPFPEELYGYEGCQVASVPCGCVDVIATTWSNGSVLLSLQDRDLVMRWDVPLKRRIVDPVDQRELDQADCDWTLSTLEYLPLAARSAETAISFAGTHPQLEFQFFVVLNHAKLVKIALNWGSLLDLAVQTGDHTRFTDAVDSPDHRPTLEVVSEQENSEGVAFVASGTGQVLAISQSRAQVDVVTVENSSVKAQEVSAPESKLILKSLKAGTTAAAAAADTAATFQTSLFGSFFEISEQLRLFKQGSTNLGSLDFQSDPNAVLSTHDESSLLDLNKLANVVVKDKIAALNRLGLQLHLRLSMQHKEFKNQIAKLCEKVGESQPDARSRELNGLVSRYEQMAAKQVASVERLDKLLDKLGQVVAEKRRLSAGNSVISKEEKRWFAELDAFSKKTLELKTSFQNYHDSLSFIKSFIYTTGVKEFKDGSRQWGEIKERLEREKRLVDYVGMALGEELNRAGEISQDVV